MYSGYKFFIRCAFCKYFLTGFHLSFHLSSAFQRMVLNFDEDQFIIYFFYGWCLGVRFKKSLPNQSHKDFFHMFSSRSLKFLGFIFRCIFHYELSSFL